MSADRFATQILKTGFVLENRVAQELKKERWTVISNRYYVDDAEESVREIDLVAYKANKVQHFDVYTVLVISCKKSEGNAWALLTRDVDLRDPNSIWDPLHAWSNDKALQFQLALADSASGYHRATAKGGVIEALARPDVEVFAFQEMNRVSGAPQNDRAIFLATTSLMKAQAYEIGALAKRKKSPSVYQFNLLSIVDADIVRLRFDGAAITEVAIDSEHYIARYIVGKEETVSRIRFLSARTFGGSLTDYNRLHEVNCSHFDSECNRFYQAILNDSKRTAAVEDDFWKRTLWPINFVLGRGDLPKVTTDTLWISWSARENRAEIYGPFEEKGIERLNNDAWLWGHVGKALRDVFRFDGSFVFVVADDIPF